MNSALAAHPHTALPPNETCAELARQLRQETRGQVLFDTASRGRYATDASIYQIMPVGVFVPTRADEVATALAIARSLKVPVLARGAGTSQCGQTTGAALVIDFSKHLRQVLALDLDKAQATVEPGLVLDALNAQLKPHGLCFPVDVSTSAQATLGGMAGNNSCGSRSIAYGNMVHNLVGAQAWLADGELLDFGPVAQAQGRAAQIAGFVRSLAEQHSDEIDARWPTLLRRVGGYNLDIFRPRSQRPYSSDGSVNLAHLLVGAEGTLALSRSLRLQLSPLPAARVLGVVNFASFRRAMDAAQHIVALGPTAVELVDRTMVELALANPAFRPTMQAALIGRPEAILLVEFAGDDAAALRRKLADLVALMGDLGEAGSVVELPDEAPQKALWAVRKAGLNIMMSVRGDAKPVSFIEDCAVPLEHLAEYTDALTEVFARHGTRGTWYAHASVGTLHVRPLLDMRVAGNAGGAARMRAIAEEASALVRKFKGAYSGEHGDGLCRGEWIAWQFGPALNTAFAAIKRELDPSGLLNPGKIIDPPAMDDPALMRFASSAAPRPYRVIAIQPALDWSAWNVQTDPLSQVTSPPGSGGDASGGLAKAVEMCNNNGHCRQFDTDTMCPSWRVSRDEQHLTRGRANTLRLALSGQLDGEDLSGPAVAQALDLCVGCKGCKRDCPTGVDMARMKIEVMAARHRRFGATPRQRLVAGLPRLLHRVAAVPGLAGLLNLRNRSGLLRRLGQRWLGLAAERDLPRWRRDTFWRAPPPLPWVSAEQALALAAQGAKVAVLFVDTFNGGFEAENAQAAARVLDAAGYALHVPAKPGDHHCCGRTALAVGDVAGARASLAGLLQALQPLAAAGIAIVGLEPSCLLTLRDEALVLGLGAAAEVVAAQALLFEEFIAREAAAGRFALTFKPLHQPIMVHGHCHQKAFAAVEPILQVLRLIPGARPELIASSCCGMAGSFGIEAEHQAVGMAMAELTLLPAIRQAPEALLVADGSSCRQQIAAGAGRPAVHAAALLAGLL